MADGIYAAAAGMAAQQTRMDAIANDLANADTPGYKSERVAFKDLVYGREGNVAVGSGAAAIDAGRSTTQGTVSDSTDPLDLAIDGPGFFQIRRPDGTVGLTRDGIRKIQASCEIANYKSLVAETCVEFARVEYNSRFERLEGGFAA